MLKPGGKVDSLGTVLVKSKRLTDSGDIIGRQGIDLVAYDRSFLLVGSGGHIETEGELVLGGPTAGSIGLEGKALLSASLGTIIGSNNNESTSIAGGAELIVERGKLEITTAKLDNNGRIENKNGSVSLGRRSMFEIGGTGNIFASHVQFEGSTKSESLIKPASLITFSGVQSIGSGSVELHANRIQLPKPAKLSVSGDVGIFTSHLENNGTVESTGGHSLYIHNGVGSGSAVTISGTGSLAADVVEVVSESGAVNGRQTSVTGLLMGSSKGSFDFTVGREFDSDALKTISILTVGNLTASNGHILVQNRDGMGKIVLSPGAQLQARGNVEITSGISLPAESSLVQLDVPPGQLGRNVILDGQIWAQGSNSVQSASPSALVKLNGGISPLASAGFGGIHFAGGVSITAGQSHFSPVCFVSPVSGRPEWRADLAECTLYNLKSCDIGEAEDHKLYLSSGHLLARAKSQTVIVCGGHDIELARGAIVWVGYTEDGIAVRSLFELRGGSVTLRSSMVHARIGAGEELFIGARSDSDLGALYAGRNVGHRRSQTRRLSDGRCVVLSEFSPLAIISNYSLASLLGESQEKSDRRALQAILKMAACLSIVTSSHGPFNSAPAGR